MHVIAYHFVEHTTQGSTHRTRFDVSAEPLVHGNLALVAFGLPMCPWKSPWLSSPRQRTFKCYLLLYLYLLSFLILPSPATRVTKVTIVDRTDTVSKSHKCNGDKMTLFVAEHWSTQQSLVLRSRATSSCNRVVLKLAYLEIVAAEDWASHMWAEWLWQSGDQYHNYLE